MDLNFRYIKTGYEINSSFFMYDGKELQSLERYHVGDVVSIIFEVDAEKAETINELGHNHLARAYSPSPFDETHPWTVHIEFEVVRRRHAASWQSTGHLRALGLSLTLQAVNWLWEDIFLWVSCGERPKWAD